jgi:hypothetical protein
MRGASGTDVAGEATTMLAGLGILTIQLFPFSLPLILLTIAPLVALGLVLALVALPLLVPFWIGRAIMSRLRSNDQGATE